MINKTRSLRLRFILDIATEAICSGIEFNTWSGRMDDLAKDRKEPPPLPSELLWVWNSLRSDFELNLAFGYLDTAPSWVRVCAKDESAAKWVEVCQKGIVFEISLHLDRDLPGMQKLYGKNQGWIPFALVQLDEPLIMRPGKATRFECSQTKCTLITPALEIEEVEHAAIIFGVAVDRIRIEAGKQKIIHVPCRSLNHAYVLASKRFERGRPCHGGRIYDRVVFRHAKRGHVSLELIRQAAEKGDMEYLAGLFSPRMGGTQSG